MNSLRIYSAIRQAKRNARHADHLLEELRKATIRNATREPSLLPRVVGVTPAFKARVIAWVAVSVSLLALWY